MDVTLIKRDGDTVHVIIGSFTYGLEQLVEKQNESPLDGAHWTIEKRRTDKWIYNIEEFLELEKNW